MRVFLLFLSSIWALLSFSCRAESDDPESDRAAMGRYAFQIEMSKGYLSGIFVANEDDANIYGSMVNEFGVSAIDFVYSKNSGKVKLTSVVSFLNKWYIKQVLKNDIKYCLHVLYSIPCEKREKNYELRREGNKVAIINKKRGLTYTFSPLNATEYDTQE